MDLSVRIWLWLIGAVCILTRCSAEDLTSKLNIEERLPRKTYPGSVYDFVNDSIWVRRSSKPSETTFHSDLKLNSKTDTKDNNSQRGKVKFFASSSSTSSLPLRRKSHVETTTTRLEKKTPSEMIDSMRDYKSKLSSPLPVVSTNPSVIEELTEDSYSEEDEDGSFDISKFVSEDFHDTSNLYTLPAYNHNEAKFESSDKVIKKIEFNAYKPNADDEFGSFRSKNSKPMRYEPRTTVHPPYFGPLTTPRTGFFDKRFKIVSEGIMKDLNIHKSAESNNIERTNINKHRERLEQHPSKESPKLYFHNTKRIVLKDQEFQGSGKKELSDVEGTSIYYELSMISTDNYDSGLTTEIDCENDTNAFETTETPTTTKRFVPSSTSRKPYITPTIPTILSTKSNRYITRVHRIRSPSSTNSTRNSIRQVTSTIRTITKSSDKPTETTTKPFSRRIQYTSPKSGSKIRMSVRRNSTKPIVVADVEIKNEISGENSKKQIITTLATDIDPIYHEENEGANKIVNAKVKIDNSIPVLRKRGSMRFKSSSTQAPLRKEVDAMAIPPTSAAWALAGMLNPSPVFNLSTSSESNVKLDDNNEIQKADLQQVSGGEVHTTTIKPLEILSTENDVELEQPWQHFLPSSFSTAYSSSPSEPDIITSTEKNMLIVFASPVSGTYQVAQSNYQPPANELFTTTRESKRDISTQLTEPVQTTPSNEWIPVEEVSSQSTTTSTEITSRDSISKLPQNYTTPGVDVDDEKVSATSFSSIISTSTVYEEGSDAFMPFSNTGTEPPFEETTPDAGVRPSFSMNNTRRPEEPLTTTTTENDVEFSTEIIPDETTTKSVESNENDWVPAFNTNRDHTVIAQTTTSDTTITTYRPIYTTATEQTEIPTTVTEATTEVVKETTTTPRPESTSVTYTITSSIESKTTTTEKESSEYVELTTRPTTTQTPIPKTTPRDEISEVTGMELNRTSEEITEPSNVITEPSTEGDINEPEDLMTNFSVDPTSDKTNLDESSGAVVAIVVSTIGVICLVLLIALLLVLRRRNRRGIYAQRCTPVSLDAYSLDSVSVGKSKKAATKNRESKRSYGNPAYDDEVVISHPMQYQALANFALDHDSMANEFTEIPSTIVKPDEIPLGCEDKNRYSNIIPLPETRVQLSRINNDPKSEYINANYVPGPGNIKNYYIACQAPMANTVVDFWRMIWEQNSRVIVMLTEYMENGVEKCFEYLPPNEVTDSKRRFGEFEVVMKRRDQKDKYAVTNLLLKNHNCKSWREIFHLWYFWPAKGVPDDYDTVIDYLLEMRSYMKISQNGREYDFEGIELQRPEDETRDEALGRNDEDCVNGAGDLNVYSPRRAEERMTNGASNGTLSRMKAAEKEGCKVRPMTVICASGCGRTGAMIVLELCARALDTTGTVDLPKAVRTVREARPHALPNKQHYIFVYKVLSEYGNKLMGGSVDSI